MQLRNATRFTGDIAVELVSAGTTAALPTTFGTPVATISSSVLSRGFGGLVTSVDVSAANFMVAPGVKFAILLRSLTPGTNARFGWLFGDVDPATGIVTSTRAYAPGINNLYNTYFDSAGATYWGRSGLDRGFATFVDVTGTGVPEPASWALLIAGFGLSGAAMRRRRMVAA